VSRILVSEKLSVEDRATIAVLVETGSDRPLEVRKSKVGVLHDRLVLGENAAFSIGTSMNTVGRQHPTILSPLPAAAAEAMMRHAERWWSEAAPLAKYPPDASCDDQEL
jgi:hypothetical protein